MLELISKRQEQCSNSTLCNLNEREFFIKQLEKESSNSTLCNLNNIKI